MTTRDSMLLDDDVPREPQLRELYQDLPQNEPPMHLDARILGAAREAVTAQAASKRKHAFSRHWAWPVSLAALVLMSVSVVVLVQPQVGMHDAALLPDAGVAPPSMLEERTPLMSGSIPAQDERPARQREVPGASYDKAQQATPPLEDMAPAAAMQVPSAPSSASPASQIPRPASPPSAQTNSTPVPPPSAALRSMPRSVQPATPARPTVGGLRAPDADVQTPQQQAGAARRAQQAAERDQVRERVRASAREARKREAAVERRAELKRLLDDTGRAKLKAPSRPEPLSERERSEARPSTPPTPIAPPPPQKPAAAPALRNLQQDRPAGAPASTTPPEGAATDSMPMLRKSTPSVSPSDTPRRALTPGRTKRGDERSVRQRAAPASTAPAGDPITRELARIRALLDAGDTALAREVLNALLKQYPDIPVPEDILSRLEQ